MSTLRNLLGSVSITIVIVGLIFTAVYRFYLIYYYGYSTQGKEETSTKIFRILNIILLVLALIVFVLLGLYYLLDLYLS